MSAPTTDAFPPARHAARPFVPRMIRTLAVPIILGWIAVIAVLNVRRPAARRGRQAAVGLDDPGPAPSMIAMKRIGEVFQEFDSNSSAMVVLEGEQPLGDDAHAYYDQLVKKLEADTRHVEHVQDFWSDPLTASGSQSNDGKAAYVQVYLRGNQGEALANESVEAVGNIVEERARAARRQGLRDRPAAPWPPTRTPRATAACRLIEGVDVHRHHRHAAARLPVDRHGADHARDGGARTRRRPRRRRVPRLSPDHRALDVRDQPAGHPRHRRRDGLRHLPDRSISGSARSRRGSRSRLLHHVRWYRARRARLGADHRRRDVLPAASPTCPTSRRWACRWRSAWSSACSPR